MKRPRRLRALAGAATTAACGGSSSGSSATAAATTRPANAPNGGTGGPGSGRGGRFGRGTAVVGSVAAKVKAAALAKYPGTIQQMVKLADGAYVAHVIRPGKGEIHVLVSKTFQVTGTQTGPPGP